MSARVAYLTEALYRHFERVGRPIPYGTAHECASIACRALDEYERHAVPTETVAMGECGVLDAIDPHEATHLEADRYRQRDEGLELR